MLTVRDILAAVDRLAPWRLAADWDNVGLMVGDRDRRVRRLLVCLNVSEATVAEAARGRADAILAHHPLIRKTVPRLTSDTRFGRLALACLADRRAVIAAHTNLDSAIGGICDILAEMLGLKPGEPLLAPPEAGRYKVVVFVPESDLDAVRDAAFAAGAGRIGDYAECSFAGEGEGTFFPAASAHPAVGAKGRRNAVRERRLELVADEPSLGRVTAAIARAHSYEEPAIDVYRLRVEPSDAGIGRVARFPKPRRLGDFVRDVKKVLGLGAVSFAGDPKQKIERVAVCTGGGNTLGDAVVAAGCQAYLCGELKYHEADDLASRGIGVILGGHYETERVPLERWSRRLAEELPGVEVVLSRTERPTMRSM